MILTICKKIISFALLKLNLHLYESLSVKVEK